MTVPFPRTIPADAPTPPHPPLDWRAARFFFDRRKAEDAAATEGPTVIGYRLTVEGVAVRTDDDAETVTPWEEVQRVATLARADEPGSDEPAADEPSRRERRQQRRQDRRDG